MTSCSFLIKCFMMVCILLAGVYSKPTSEAIVGSPHLFHEYDFAVDPYKSSQLSPAFQAANGARGSKLIAYFGTGGLRSVERPARPAYHHN
ncbi:hypothetical protein OUZ56_028695 [Daphnia magna]|uniref:Uncharacterized protein n=2 Tax=Daphnia magna TaxID=35525 RepID=A0ABR0B4N4_9CRUS|nr:hypothetical protein OUZ56_028695 [Daphnia magna]